MYLFYNSKSIFLNIFKNEKCVTERKIHAEKTLENEKQN